MGIKTFDGIKKLMCMFTLVFFVMSLTVASVSAGSNDTYKVEKAKLDAEKTKLEKEKIRPYVPVSSIGSLEAQKKKLSTKNKTDKEYQNWLKNYNNFLTKYNKCLSKYKTWETKYNTCVKNYKVLEQKYKK